MTMQSHAGRRTLRAFACQRCIARASLAAQTASSPWPLTRINSPKQRQHCRRYSSSVHPDEGIQQTPEDFLESRQNKLPIRERLRTFEGVGTGNPTLRIIRDAARMGTENAMTRNESQALAEIEAGESQLDGVNDPDALRLWSDMMSGGGADSDNVSSTLARPYGAVAPQPGDLIEVSTNSWRVQVLAVFLGKFRGVDHFYTSIGKWFVSSGVRSLFTVTRFASEEELAPLVAALPNEVVQEAGAAGEDGSSSPELSVDSLDSMLNSLQNLKLGPTREAGAVLLKKMAAFQEQAAAIHMNHAGVLDNAFEVLQKNNATSLTRPTSMNLDEIASLLLRRQNDKKLGPRGQHGNHRHNYPLRNLRGAGSGAEGMDEFTAPAMYAVFRAVRNNDVAFRPLTTTMGNVSETDDALSAPTAAAGKKQFSHSRSCLFSIAPPDDISIINDASMIVREYYEMRGVSSANGSKRGILDGKLGSFLLRARRAIDLSRRTRKWSPYGMLGPFVDEAGQNKTNETTQEQSKPPGMVVEPWSPTDLSILQFIHLWASSQRFSPSSRMHGVGSGILRALDRYGESEYLTMSTGWTFLQEVGWVSPWDISARYSTGTPDALALRTGGVDRLLPSPPNPGSSSSSSPSPSPSTPNSPLSDDIFAGRRKEWNAHTTYCIDAASTTDIDDGIALERIAGSSDEFWVHIHVADPAARIRPGSVLAEQAARMPLTAYLQGFYEPMFTSDLVYQEFSLDTGKPCLTFSARVNRQGTVLESKITPGRLGPVVFITPGQVSAVVADAEKKAMRDHKVEITDPSALDMPWTAISFSVGTPPSSDALLSSKARRPVTAADELSPDQRADLKTLASLGTALRAVRLQNGAKPLFWPRPSVKVSLDNTSIDVVEVDAEKNRPLGEAVTASNGSSTAFLKCAGDPYIQVYYEEAAGKDNDAAVTSQAGSRLVESIMRLAGEVAADWCHDRGIAVPFRGQPDALPYIDRIQALTLNEINPALAAGRRPSETALRELNRYMGADDITAVAVPHIIMGVARYTKATSPLRRYSDLLVHWQVEGALLAEMDKENGKSSDESATSTAAGPPFTRQQMERDILPLLRVRERAVRKLDNVEGKDRWMLQALVRAWLGDKTRNGTIGEGSSQEDPFKDLRLTITRVSPRRGVASGRLNWFDRTALVEGSDLNATTASGENDGMQRLTINDIVPGQVYPVALSHVDVHSNVVLVRRTGDCIEEST